MVRAITSAVLAFGYANAGRNEMETYLNVLKNNTVESEVEARGIVAVDNPLFTTLEPIWGYGCWCYFQEDHGKGSGEPQNFVDKHCQTLHHGYTCIMMDALDDSDPGCDPFTQDYNTIQIIGNDVRNVDVDCEAQNNGDNCAIRSCAVETYFILNIFHELFTANIFDPSLKHDLGNFDPKTECRSQGNGQGPGGNSSPWDCCAPYPARFPYKTNNGARGCCGRVTYDATLLNCCAGDILTVSSC